ncbi:MAG: hypothetical protein IPK86_00435 [Neisseriales bacterium]|nr:MAG: hypothetical protein IPK86_00435 [Neisseriales bacterium]
MNSAKYFLNEKISFMEYVDASNQAPYRGGMRAAAFHAGALKYLAEKNF